MGIRNKGCRYKAAGYKVHIKGRSRIRIWVQDKSASIIRQTL